MDLKDFFLAQKRAIRVRTNQVLDAIKPEHLGWRPEPGALSVAEMARHVWHSEHNVRRLALTGDFSYYERRIPQGLRAVLGTPDAWQEERAQLERVHAETLAQVAGFPAERWQEMRSHAGLGYQRKVAVILLGINEHEIHHRAQLMTYLRMLGSPVPEAIVRK